MSEAAYEEHIENPKNVLSREVEQHIKFFVPGTFGSMYAAERWLRENGYSWGSSCVGVFQGIKKGPDVYVAKWKNLTIKERKSCDGVMYSSDRREGVVEVVIFKKK